MSVDSNRWKYVRRIKLAGIATEITIKNIRDYADETGHVGIYHHRNQPDYVRIELNPQWDAKATYVQPVEGWNEIYVGDVDSITFVMTVSSTTNLSLYRGRS